MGRDGRNCQGLGLRKACHPEAAFKGVNRALLISTDALDRPGRRLAQHKAAVSGMQRAGVQHVIYTSMPKPENSPLLIAPDHLGTEQALAASQIPNWTVLRNHWYFENLFGSLPSALASGNWYSAADGKGTADISRDDLAFAAATVLASNSTGRRSYTLSGPEALTCVGMAKELSAMLGKPLNVVPVPLEALVQGMVSAGLPEPSARVYASFDANTAAGRVAEVTNDFREITGKAPQSFRDWLAENKAALAKL